MSVEQFWRDGYLVLRGVISPEEMERWRRAALDRGPNPADLLSDDVLREIVLDERLLGLSRDLLGGDVVYFCDSTVAIGPNGWGFHKDNSDRVDPKAPDWHVDRFPIIRFGLYAQPHGSLPGGLDLRRGSHLHADFDTGEMVSPELRPGDVIVWSQRTTHSADSRILKILGKRIEPKPSSFTFRAFARLPQHLFFRKHPQTRVAFFVSYARPHPLLDRHLEYLKQRAYPWDSWQASSWSEETRRLAAEKGLGLIDLTGQAYDGREVHESYHPIPY